MANYASNEINIRFKEDMPLIQKLEFLTVFNEKYNTDLDVNDDSDNIVVCFESRWVAPVEDLRKLKLDYEIESIKGVSTEWGNDYYEAFEI